MLQISVDTGNKHVKTEHFTMNTALSESKTLLTGNEDALFFNGKYYTTTSNRIAYMRDKTVDDRFFILTLYAVAKELTYKIEHGELEYKNGDALDITLLVGLPPAHMQQLLKPFKRYLRRGGDFFGIRYGKYTFMVRFAKVRVYPQCYAAAVYGCKNLMDYRRTITIDIGGMTEDVLMYEKDAEGNLVMNTDVLASLEHGVIKLFRKIEQDCNILGVSLSAQDEDLIEDVIMGRPTMLSKSCIETIRRDASIFSEECISSVVELVSNVRTCFVFICGGGAILLKPYLEEVAKKMLGQYQILEDAKANVKGYMLMHEAETRK